MGSSSNTAAAGSINYPSQAKPSPSLRFDYFMVLTHCAEVLSFFFFYFSHTKVAQSSFGQHTVIAPLNHHTGQGITVRILFITVTQNKCSI
jgi:hypothetical protein